MNTTLISGADLSLAVSPSTLGVDGRGRSIGAHPVTCTGVFAHQVKTGVTAGNGSTAQMTDLRGIPPRGDAPV